MGMVKVRGTQRTDSMAVLSRARTLTRLGLVSDTIRVAVKTLLHADPEWTRRVIPPEWDKLYGPPCKSERMSEEQREEAKVRVGRDGQWLLDRLEEEDAAHLRELRDVETMRLIWKQHFLIAEDATVAWTPTGDHGGADAIESPYDPEARWSKKGSFNWIGDKLQVTETDDEGLPHLITDIDLTPATDADFTALDDIRERQEARGVLPSERYADSGYISGPTIKDGRANYGEDLIGPIRDVTTPQSKRPDGLIQADFQIDLLSGQVICPGGIEVFMTKGGDGTREASFPARLCQTCPLGERCYTGTKGGRTLRFGPAYEETQAARQRQKTEAFKTKYRRHRGGVESCLSALVHGHGIRRNRYDRRVKNRLRALCTAAALNLTRAAAWRAGYRPRKHQPNLGLAVRKPAAAVGAEAGGG